MAGFSLEPNENSNLFTTVAVSATGGTITAIPSVTGQIIRVYKLFLTVTTAGTLQFEDGSTALSGAIALGANGAITLDLDGTPWFSCGKGNAFTIVAGSGITVAGQLYYRVTNF